MKKSNRRFQQTDIFPLPECGPCLKSVSNPTLAALEVSARVPYPRL
jgi:hypothetical protein